MGGWGEGGAGGAGGGERDTRHRFSIFYNTRGRGGW
jgi:hypothetical protein